MGDAGRREDSILKSAPTRSNSAAAPVWGGRFSVVSAGAGIAAAAILAYGNSFHGPFLHDDAGSIVRNLTIRKVSSGLFPPPGGYPVSGRPVLNLSFALNYAMSGMEVWSYHALNLLIHVFAAWTLFGIVKRSLPILVAFAIALLWSVHPLQTESVTYLSQRAESLMGLFYLLTLYGFIRFSEAPAGIRSASWGIVAVLACLLGMGTKEVMATAPVMVLLYDRAFIAGSFVEAWRRRRRFYFVLGLTWLPLAWLVAQGGGRGGTAGFGSSVAWWAYGYTQLRAVASYLRLSLFPYPLTFDYGLILGGPPPVMIVDAVLIGGLVGASAWLLWRNSKLGFLGAWFFGILSPSSTVVPIATEIIAEHRVFLPLAAVITLVVCAIRSAGGRLVARGILDRRQAVGAGVAALVLASVALGAATRRRNEVYLSAVALWGDAVEKTPRNAGSRNNYGNALAEQGKLPEAIEQFREALRLVPGFDDPHYNLGNALATQGRLTEAIEHYQAALQVQPRSAAIRFALGEAFRRSGRTAEAEAQYLQALSGDSETAEVWYRLGNALLNGGRWPESAQAFARAVKLKPDFPDALINYAGVLAQLGRNDEAAAEFRAALAFEPNAADVHNDFGGVLAQSGHLPEARAEFETALRLKPDYSEARNNLERVKRMISARPAAQPALRR
jgi:tetratricopeptide (TPR) repeat protein